MPERKTDAASVPDTNGPDRSVRSVRSVRCFLSGSGKIAVSYSEHSIFADLNWNSADWNSNFGFSFSDPSFRAYYHPICCTLYDLS